MAIIGNTYLTLKDKLAQTENGRAASAIVDLLAQSNALIEDAVVRECNEGSTHKTTVRNGLPEVEFRKFYQGVNSSILGAPQWDKLSSCDNSPILWNIFISSG